MRPLFQKTHQTIHKVTRDIEDRFHFNTAISAIMELFNTISGIDINQTGDDQLPVVRTAVEAMILLLSPIVPHFAEELWAQLGNTDSVLTAPWPQHRKDALVQEELLIVVQVNGTNCAVASRLTPTPMRKPSKRWPCPMSGSSSSFRIRK